MDFSGFGINKAFKTGLDPQKPYYYINASLDLSGRASGTYYFNADNNFDYALLRDYSKFITIDENMVIGEVSVFANNELIDVDSGSPNSFYIGGTTAPSDPNQVLVPWAAPSGSVAGLGDLFSSAEINAGSVHLYGHEGGHLPYVASPINRKYLAISINPDPIDSIQSDRSSLPLKRSKRKLFRGLPGGDPVLLEGKVSVSLKIYPKTQ